MPQPDILELQCLHGILPSKYRTKDLEQLSATIDLEIGVIQLGLDTLTKAVAMIHEANPTAALCIPEIDNLQA